MKPPSRQRGMAVVLAVGWLLALMLMIQALALEQVLDDDRNSLRGFQQLQAFEAARSGLDWGWAQMGRSTSPCPLASSMLKALKTPLPTAAPAAVPDTAWMNCSWPQTTQARAEDSAQEPRCVCTTGNTTTSAQLSTLKPPGFALQFSRPAGSTWLIVQATGCAADCDPVLGHTARTSLQWRWQPAWLAPAAWPVAVLAGGRISAESITPLSVYAPGNWALAAAHDALPLGSSSPLVDITGGRWDNAQGSHPAASVGLPTDLAAWLAAASSPNDSSAITQRLGALWMDARWPASGSTNPTGSQQAGPLIRVSGDWSVPAGTRLGSVEEPVLLRVDGTLHLNEAGVRITGLVVAGAVDISAGLTLDGALWAGGNVILSGSQPIVLHHDPVLAQSAWLLAGRFVARRGSWRDF